MSSAKKLEKLFWVTGWIYDFSKIATILLIVGLLCHYFFVTALVVRGRSMVPNFTDGEVLMVNKISYRLQSPERGDVVAMFWPGETQKRFIKRIIGLPGETISVVDGQVFIGGVELSEPYLPTDLTTSGSVTRTLQADEYFVFGDNRLASSDSRAWGPVPKSFLIGKVGTELFNLPSSQSLAN